MKIEKLTESEELVVKAVWKCDTEPMLSEIVEKVNSLYGKDWRPQTVSTFLAKLVRKKYLKLCRNGKIYTYKILITESKYNLFCLKKLYDFLYDGNKEKLKNDVDKILKEVS